MYFFSCWLKPNFAIFFGMLPIAIMLVFNTIIFIMIIINYIQKQKRIDSYFKNSSTEKLIKIQKSSKKELIFILSSFLMSGEIFLL